MSQPPGTKLYIVKLNSPEEAVSFYEDMETPGGNLYIPDRAVESSYINHKTLFAKYRLTEQEAEQVAADPRVVQVKLDDSELPVTIEPLWIQTADYFRGTYTTGTTTVGSTGTYSGTDKNWGLVKITTGKNYYTLPISAPDYRWGSSNGVFRRLPWTVATKFDGKHVDVVIVDGHLRPNHAEFAVNPDGTGGSRFVNYNWLQHAVNDPTNIDITKVHHPAAVGETYDYTDTGATDGAGDHGTHVAGTVAGNTQGWARQANIYNISIFDDSVNFNISAYVYDYIRAFHASKAVNPATGRKNPTVVNASIGSSWNLLRTTLTDLSYRGTVVTGSFDTTGNIVVGSVGIPLTNYDWGYSAYNASTGRYKFPKNFDDQLMADIDAMVDDGIIFVCAAGNDNWTQEVPTDPGWNTTYVTVNYNFTGVVGATAPYRHYYSRRGGCQTEKTINVAAAGFDAYEYLTDFTNRGNAITIVSPGQGIISSVANVQPGIYSGATVVGTRQLDPRNLNNDRIEPYQGTSMASPQVAGVLALLAEVAPDLNNTTAKAFMAAHAKTNQLNDFTVGTIDHLYFGLKNTVNRYLFLPQQTITVTQNKTSADKSDVVTYTITANNLPPNSVLYWTVAGTALAADFTDSALQGSVVIASTTGTITRTVNASATYNRTFTLSLRSGGFTGNVQFLANTVTIEPPGTTTTTTIAGSTTTTTTIPGSTTTTTTVAGGTSTTTTTIAGSTTTTTTIAGSTTTTTLSGINFTITTDCAGPNNTGRILVSARTGASTYRTYQPQTSESAAQNVTTNFYTTNGFIVFDTGDGITTGTWYVKVADNSDPSIYLVKSVVVNCTTTTTTQARSAKSSYIFFNRGFGLSECCGEDNNGDRFIFSSGPPAPLLPGQTSTTTTTSTSTTSTTTQGPPPEPFFPILDLVKKEQTRRRFIARLRLNGPSGPIVANSKVITVTNMPSNTLLPTVFTNSLLSDQISTRFNSAYHQKTINTLTIAASRIDTRTVDYCYDDRVFVYVTGRATGNVWGGGNYYGTVTPYSEDSDIHTAAVHAGIVQVNQTALVKRHQIDYYKEETRPSFFGDYKNGVMSKTRLEGCGYTFDITNVPPIVILPHLFYFFKQTFTATANQTIFTVTRPGDYILQQCLVFQNGILLDTSEYTDTSTSTVTLTTGATLGNDITVVSFKSTNSIPQVQPSFTRYSVNLNQNFEYAPSGFSVTPGVDLVFLNGVIFPDSDYVLINGRITFRLPVTGTLTIIVWSLDDKSQPNGNPLNIAINTVIGQTTYNTTFDPLAFNLYNNGVLLVDANDYTVGVDSYTLASSPTSTLNTLLQQSFTRTGI